MSTYWRIIILALFSPSFLPDLLCLNCYHHSYTPFIYLSSMNWKEHSWQMVWSDKNKNVVRDTRFTFYMTSISKKVIFFFCDLFLVSFSSGLPPRLSGSAWHVVFSDGLKIVGAVYRHTQVCRCHFINGPFNDRQIPMVWIPDKSIIRNPTVFMPMAWPLPIAKRQKDNNEWLFDTDSFKGICFTSLIWGNPYLIFVNSSLEIMQFFGNSCYIQWKKMFIKSCDFIRRVHVVVVVVAVPLIQGLEVHAQELYQLYNRSIDNFLLKKQCELKETLTSQIGKSSQILWPLQYLLRRY